ncbi:MAG TPA: hypothetical protein VFI11_11150 [Anaerolineales bacterium]|nr:hypothetical protein [Anaerolineales bacterium]
MRSLRKVTLLAVSVLALELLFAENPVWYVTAPLLIPAVTVVVFFVVRCIELPLAHGSPP